MPTFTDAASGEPGFLELGVLVRLKPGVGLLAGGRLLLDAGAVLQGNVGDGIDDVPSGPRTNRENRARSLARADEDMVRPPRAVDEVPGLQRPLLVLDDKESLAVEDEEVLLLVLAVVPARGLARLEDADVDADLRKAGVALEARKCAEDALQPARVASVEHEPALAFGREPGTSGFERSLWNHARILTVMEGFAELHTHLGGSVASEILWSLAHEQGIALPVKDFWEFDRLVTVSDPRGVPNLDALDQIYHWTELIQSSPIAVERSVHAAIGGAYRSQGITTLELRFNPMKRNRGGERDLDHIILAAIRGLDRASLEYPQVRAGLILMMDRTFSAELNSIIVEKAIRWAPRGIVGVDIAGPRPDRRRYDYKQVVPMVEEARAAGLGVTIHVGEEGGDVGREEVGEVVEALRPDRIGHGILAAGDAELMAALREAEIVLEICPTSNLLTKALADEEAVRETIRAFVEAGVPFTIATDGPEMMRTHLRDELDLLRRIGALDEDELAQANRRGHKATFLHEERLAPRV
jgi:adenosine deaminase